MRKDLFLQLLTAAICLGGCKEYETTADIVVLNVPAKECMLTDIADDIEIITLHSTEPLDDAHYIFKIDENCFTQSSSNELLYHYVDGQLKQTLNKVGRGPGEYFEIDLFDYDPVKGLVYISDRSDREIIVYDANNNFEHVRTIKINQSQTLPIMALLDSDHLMHVASPNTDGAFASMKILNLQDLSIDSICGFNQHAKLASTVTMGRNSNTNMLFGICDHVSYICKYVNKNGKYGIDTLYSVQMGDGYDIPYDIANADTRTEEGFWKYQKYNTVFGFLPIAITQRINGIAFIYSSNCLSHAKYGKYRSGLYLHNNDGIDMNISKLTVPGLKRDFITTFQDGEHYFVWFNNTYENVETIIDSDTEPCPLAVKILQSILTDKTVSSVIVSYKLK